MVIRRWGESWFRRSDQDQLQSGLFRKCFYNSFICCLLCKADTHRTSQLLLITWFTHIQLMSEDSGRKIHYAFSKDHIVVMSWKIINKNVRTILKSEFNFHTPFRVLRGVSVGSVSCGVYVGVYICVYMDIVHDVFKRLSVIGCDVWLTAGRWWFVNPSVLTV